MRMNFDSTYVQTSTSNTHSQTRPHTCIHTKSKISIIYYKLCSLLFSTSFCTYKLQLLNTYQNGERKTITDSGFRSNIFTDKLYAHTPLKNSPQIYQLLNSHSLTFIPASEKRKLLPFPGIRFNVPVFIYIYFIRRFEPKSSVIHS